MVVLDTTKSSNDSPSAKLTDSPQALPPPYGAFSRCENHVISGHKSAAKRFLKALIAALLICFLFNMFSGDIRAQWNDSWEYDIPTDLHLDQCPIDTTDVSFNSTFELPVSSTTLFLIARGSKAVGKLNVLQSDDVGDNVRVEVTAKSKRPRALRRVRVCRLSRRDGENGVGIFTPVRYGWFPWDPVRFDVKVTFPASPDAYAPLAINKFETDLPLYAQHVGKLGDGLFMEKLLLKSSNTPISVESINTRFAFVETTNAHISGTFESSSSLILDTTNAGVEARVFLHSNGSDPAFCSIQTTNGPIDSVMFLLSPPDLPGTYSVEHTTTNAPLTSYYLGIPPDSTLSLKAHTSNAAARMFLDEGYEGRFLLRTSNSKASVEVREDVGDPSGKGRTRVMKETRLARGVVAGVVYWKEEEEGDEEVYKGEGLVNVASSNGPVSLSLR